MPGRDECPVTRKLADLGQCRFLADSAHQCSTTGAALHQRGLRMPTSPEPAIHSMAVSIVILVEPHSQCVFLGENLDIPDERDEQQRSGKWAQRTELDGPAYKQN